MRGMSRYGAVATRIRGMRSHLLSTEEYSRIASCENVHDIAVYLKSHPSYSSALSELDPDNMRRARFERLLLNALLEDIKKISHFLDRDQKKMLSVYDTFFELRFINNVVRQIFNSFTDPVDLSVYRAMYSGSKNFNFNAVVSAASIEELIRALEGSKYSEPIEHLYKTLDDPGLFDYETALNRFYFSDFWEQVNRFNSGYDRQVLLEVHGVEIDMLNMIWIYRAKTYYNISPQEISRFLIPAYHDLKPREVSAMAAAQSTGELMNIIGRTKYRRYINTANPSSMEDTRDFLIDSINDKNRKKYPYSFAVIESYIFNKRTEIEHLIRITESVRYGYDPGTILKGLKIGN